MRFPLINSNRSAWISYLFGLGLLVGLAFPFVEQAGAYPPDAQAKRSPLLAALQAELDRSMKTYGTQDPQAYYVGYTVTDTQRVDVSGSNGALLNSSEDARQQRQRRSRGRHAAERAIEPCFQFTRVHSRIAAL